MSIQKQTSSRKIRILIAALCGLVFAVPTVISAATCCTCTIASGANSSVCLTDSSGDCAAVAEKVSNGYDCSSVAEGQCKLKSEGGACVKAPTPADDFKKSLGTPPAREGNPIIAPVLNVPLPGLEFASNVTVENKKIKVPFLAQYITWFYRYIVGLSLVASAVMVVYGGFLYILGGTTGNIQRAKDVITNSIAGLLLVLTSYAILDLVNSSTATNFKALELPIAEKDGRYVQGIDALSWAKFVKDAGMPKKTQGKDGDVGMDLKPEDSTVLPVTDPNGSPMPTTPPSKEEIQAAVGATDAGTVEDQVGERGNPPEMKSINGLVYNPSECPFKMNEVGIPTLESTIECAKIIGNRIGVSPCYAVVAMNYESGGSAVPTLVGHDEETWAVFGGYVDENKNVVNGNLSMYLNSTEHDRRMVNFWAPGGAKYLVLGKTYSGKTFPACSPSCGPFGKCSSSGDVYASVLNYLGCESKALKNDDLIPDPNRDDLGLDWRFSHGVGPGQTTVFPGSFCDCQVWSDTPVTDKRGNILKNKDGTPQKKCKEGKPSVKFGDYCVSLKQLMSAYGGLWTSLAIAKKAGATKNPTFPEASKVWGAYAGAESGQSQRRALDTVGCANSNPQNPIMSLRSAGNSICRGDYGLDRAACEKINDERRENNKKNAKNRELQKPLIKCTDACGADAPPYDFVQSRAFKPLGIRGKACDPKKIDKRTGEPTVCPPLTISKPGS